MSLSSLLSCPLLLSPPVLFLFPSPLPPSYVQERREFLTLGFLENILFIYI